MTTRYEFAGEICLKRIIELANLLRPAIDTGADLTIDGSDFEAVDFAGIQMLLAAHRRALRTGANLRVTVPDHGPLREALARYGYAVPAPLPFVEAA